MRMTANDEDFLRDMKCNQFTEYYYRVSRNERQKSIIERQSIAEVSSPPMNVTSTDDLLNV